MASPVAVPADTHIGINTYTLFIEGFVKGSRLAQVLSFFDPTGGLPVSPSAGDRYIASATANGWTLNNIYYFDGPDTGIVDGWVEVIPTEGELTYVVGGAIFPAQPIIWNGATWQAFGGGGGGDVNGPGASTVNAIVRWANAAGTAVANSTVLVTNAGDIQIPVGGCLEVNSLVTACRDANGNQEYGDGNYGAITTGTGNITLGDGVGGTITSGTGNLLLGGATDVVAGATTNAIVLGTGSSANTNSIAIGTGASSTGTSSAAIGTGANDGGFASTIAIGAGVTSFEDDSVLIRSANTLGGGGTIYLWSSDGAAAGDGAGSLSLQCGEFAATGAGTGGGITLAGQATADGNAGSLTMIAGSASGTGDGGSINLTPGVSTGGGANGAVNIDGALVMPVGEAVGTAKVLSFTTVAGTPTNTTVATGAAVYDTTNDLLYMFNGATWEAYTPNNRISYVATTYPGSAVGVIATGPTMTYATTTLGGGGTAQANLADLTAADAGRIKYISMSAYVVDLQVNITTGLDANGNAMSTITFTSAGQGAMLTWDGTRWLILNSGAVVA
jgi:hypothetical protein